VSNAGCLINHRVRRPGMLGVSYRTTIVALRCTIYLWSDEHPEFSDAKNIGEAKTQFWCSSPSLGRPVARWLRSFKRPGISLMSRISCSRAFWRNRDSRIKGDLIESPCWEGGQHG
jgi:hypothetical protein